MATVSQQLTITVQPAPPPPLQIVTTSLPAAQIGTPYLAQIEVQGGVPPETIEITQGALPDGLTLHSDGSIDGTPASDAVDETFTVTVTDSATPNAATVSATVRQR